MDALPFPGGIGEPSVGVLKILDLGLARLQGDNAEEPNQGITATGHILGTPDYMAPEQWDDTHAVDARADLYALGCTLFCLLTGRPPYGDSAHSSLAKKMMAHANAAIPDLRAARHSAIAEGRFASSTSDIPDDVDAIYRRLLAKDPTDRIQTAAELADALSSAMRQLPGTDLAATIDHDGPPVLAQLKPATRRKQLSAKLSAWGCSMTLAVSVSCLLFVVVGLKLFVPMIRGYFDSGMQDLEGETDRSVEAYSNLTRPDSGPTTPLGAPPRDASDRKSGEKPRPAVMPLSADEAKRQQDAWAKHLGVPVEWTNSIGMKFRLLPPGEFIRGSEPDEIDQALRQITFRDERWEASIRSEAPRHRVVLTSAIYLSAHEVTQGQYEEVMEKNPSYFSRTGSVKQYVDRVAGMDTSRFPVEGVSWDEAVEFCGRLYVKEGFAQYVREGKTFRVAYERGYRLPSEAQWEFACRAGLSESWATINATARLDQDAWYQSNSGGRTHAVGERLPNAFGFFDLQGNVVEWVQDAWDPTEYGKHLKQPAVDPLVISGTLPRVLRGGGWNNAAIHCRPASRNVADREAAHFGFRITLPVEAVREAIQAKKDSGNDQ